MANDAKGQGEPAKPIPKTSVEQRQLLTDALGDIAGALAIDEYHRQCDPEQPDVLASYLRQAEEKIQRVADSIWKSQLDSLRKLGLALPEDQAAELRNGRPVLAYAGKTGPAFTHHHTTNGRAQ